MKTVFLSGKITGDPNYRAKFEAAAQELTAAGFAVMNPATLPDGYEYDAYIRICNVMLDESEAVCFLLDYLTSSGALQELLRAHQKHKEIIYFGLWQKRRREAGETVKVFILTETKTQRIAFKCLNCGFLNIYSAASGDGRSCEQCGGPIKPLGFVKANA